MTFHNALNSEFPLWLPIWRHATPVKARLRQNSQCVTAVTRLHGLAPDHITQESCRESRSCVEQERSVPRNARLRKRSLARKLLTMSQGPGGNENPVAAGRLRNLEYKKFERL